MKVVQYTILIIFLFLTSISFASLSSHPSSYTETVQKGSSKTIELHISNSFSTPLNYSFNIDKNWISVSPASGSVGGNQTLTVVVKLDAAALDEGQYSGTLTIIDPHHGGIDIPVNLSVTSVTDVRENKITSSGYALNQNYPNPFNPSTTISFALASAQKVKLTIYNAIGTEIQKLVDGNLSSGWHSIKFDASEYPSGIYFYSLETSTFVETRKMILVK